MRILKLNEYIKESYEAANIYGNRNVGHGGKINSKDFYQT
jgi:hypothetical protein